MKWLLGICALVLAGAGCQVVDMHQAAAEALALRPAVGTTFTLRESAFGWAGTLVEALHKDAGRRVVTLDAWESSESSLTWHKGDADMGTIRSRARTSGLLLPSHWEATDVRTDDMTLWLSPEVFSALAEETDTHVSFGLFDDQLARGIATLEQVNAWLVRFGQQPIASVDADPTRLSFLSRGRFTLLVNGKVKTVETLEAGNWAARMTVLHNPDMPLILAVKLTPAAYGPDAAVSPLDTFSDRGSSFEIVSLDIPTAE